MKYLNTNTAKMALPLILSNITVPLLGLTDTTVMGHLPHSYYLAAVGLGTMIFNFLYWGFAFLRMGVTGLVSQAHGANDQRHITDIIYHSLLLALVCGIGLIAFQTIIENIAFSIIGSSDTIRHYAQHYYFVRIWGAPATLTNYVLIGAFIGIHKTRVPLVLMLTINSLAILLDIFLVLHIGMRVEGVALADVIAQYAGCALGLYLLVKHFHLKTSFKLRAIKLKRALLKKLMSANTNIFIRSLCLTLAFSFFTVQSTKLGVLYLAANTVLMNFQMILSFALDGFANVAEALVGKHVGAKNYSGFRMAVLDTAAWSSLIAVGFVLVYALFGKTIINLITSIPAVQATAYTYLPFMIVLPLVAVWSFLLDGIFIGATKFKAMRNTMIFSGLAYLVVWYLLIHLGNTGLWIAFLSLFAFRGLSLFLVFHFYRYQNAFIR